MQTADQTSAIRKLTWRIGLPVTLGFLVAYIDRANAGFAALQMNKDLGLTAAEFGIGAGLFFLTYVAFEILSTLIQHRVGGPRWLSRIRITRGIVAAGI